MAGFCQLTYLFSVIYFEKKIRHYETLHFKSLDLAVMKNMFRIFLPVAVQNTLAFAVFLVYESIIGSIGTVYLAATHVIFSIFRINKTLVGGFAQGSAILVGNALGAGQKEEAIEIVHGCQKIASIIGTVVILSVLIFPEAIMAIFVKDTRTITIGVKALYYWINLSSCLYF